ncbi:MAG: hypothetical protein JO257_05715 [Deltaproteobacteria bacterium]|nr:hypothetical protein [Deltaproteobacteria bacterium]
MQVGPRAPAWGLLPTLVLALMCATVSAQPRKGERGDKAAPATADKAAPVAKETGSKKEKVKNFDFNALDLNGRMRTPQLLYFLERANEELERASLEKRSFIPAMAKSVEEEQL